MEQNRETFQGIIITGGPGSGKTTLVCELEKLGFIVHHEVARRIIREQLEIGSDAVPWENIHAFSALAKELMLKEFPINGIGYHFFDRGIPDLIGYFLLSGHQVKEDYYETLKKMNYHKRVFLLPPWEEIYNTDNERKESFEEACRVYGWLKQTYLQLGFEIVEIPPLQLEKRVDYFLNQL